MFKCALPETSFAIKALLLAACVTAAVPSLPAQATVATPAVSSAPAGTPYVATMTFDVASVRENKDIDTRSFMMSGYFIGRSSTYRAVNWPIENLITNAYGVDRYQIAGAPEWPWPTLFMIEAKSGSEADAKFAGLTQEQRTAEQHHMLQALLEDRFKLKTHWETRDGDIYNLVVAKGGPKLGAEGSMPPSADESKMFGSRSMPPLDQKRDGQGYDFIAHACSMGDLVRMLSVQLGRRVIDKTGLTAKYDFVLKYRGRLERERAADDMDPMPPMDRAVEQELGLKVESAKGPIQFLVIDHIEKPSPN
jgi:uncharacterized protein (TIGR03435 family)